MQITNKSFNIAEVNATIQKHSFIYINKNHKTICFLAKLNSHDKIFTHIIAN